MSESVSNLSRRVEEEEEEILNIDTNNDVSQIVKLRNEFSAHATLEEVHVTFEEFNKCKALAGKAIINYIHQQARNIR